MTGSPFRTNLFGQERDDVGIHPNSVGTAELENGSVTAAKLATSFPQGTLGYAAVTANQTGITTITDIVGLTTTVTVPAGRRLRVTMEFNAQSNNAGSRIDAIITDAANNIVQLRSMSTGSVNLNSVIHVEAVVTPAAGAHTFKGRIQDGAGVGTIALSASSITPAFILVEDITAITASQPIAVPTGLWRASADFPASPAEGDLFYETDTDKLWAYNGTAWVQQVASGAWDSWTPTLTNMSLGNGALLAKYTRTGRNIFWRFRFTLGSTSTMGTSPTISPPVSMAAYTTNREPVGTAEIADAGTANINGRVLENGGNLAFFVLNVAGTYMRLDTITASVPMVWTINDVLAGSGFYEAST